MKVSIVGGSGYTGGELLRILSIHPRVEIQHVFSRSNAGKYIHDVHPLLKGIIKMKFTSLDNLNLIKNSDVVFSCLPHGVSKEMIPKIIDYNVKIIDLSGDFRLKEASLYKRWYHFEHKNPEILAKFVYGIPEIFKEEISKAKYVSVPGCIAIASILALYPFAKRGLIKNTVYIDAKVGSSGSGKNLKISSIFSERFNSIKAYKPAMHRHSPEIETYLQLISNKKFNVLLAAHTVNIVRGILATIYLDHYEELPQIWKYYREDFGNEKFIRIIRNPRGYYKYPDPKFLLGSNFVDIGFEIDEINRKIVLMVALDNLVKGASGNAIQCMNIMFGLNEDEGLNIPPIYPI